MSVHESRARSELETILGRKFVEKIGKDSRWIIFQTYISGVPLSVEVQASGEFGIRAAAGEVCTGPHQNLGEALDALTEGLAEVERKARRARENVENARREADEFFSSAG